MIESKKILVIQTSFLGDAILATSILESLHKSNPNYELHLLVRKGNEALFEGHPFLKTCWVWDKKANKLGNLLRMISAIRSEKFDVIVNVHRYLSSGLITALSGAKTRIGFDKNPLSWAFTQSIIHRFNGGHEIDRNHKLIQSLVLMEQAEKPRLYPTAKDMASVAQFQVNEYVCIAPTSVWNTKQWPKEKWVELIQLLPSEHKVYLLGAKNDRSICEWIQANANRDMIEVLAGKLSFLQSAALMAGAKMNYVNDSAPMHLASATNAPTTVIYCSTIPGFGFGPLSDRKKIVQLETKLDCRPCGLHGFNACPQGHFNCAKEINPRNVL